MQGFFDHYLPYYNNTGPYWIYKLHGIPNDYKVKEHEQIDVYERDGNQYYRLSRFSGPVIEIQVNISTKEYRYFPYKNLIQEIYSTRFVNFIVQSLPYQRFYYLAEALRVDYKSNKLIDLKDTALNDLSILLSVYNGFAPFIYPYKNFYITIKWHGKVLKLFFNQIDEFMNTGSLKKEDHNASAFLHYLFDTYSINKIYQSDNTIYSNYNAVISLALESFNYSYISLYEFLFKRRELEFKIISIHIPVLLKEYIKTEITRYVAFHKYKFEEEEKEVKELLAEEARDEDERNHEDYREWIRDGEDDLSQADLNWRWNID